MFENEEDEEIEDLLESLAACNWYRDSNGKIFTGGYIRHARPILQAGRRKWNKVRDNRIAYVKHWRAAHECIQKDAITRCTSTLQHM